MGEVLLGWAVGALMGAGAVLGYQLSKGIIKLKRFGLP